MREISTRKINKMQQELRWVMMELSCVQPALTRNREAFSSIHECIERLQYLDMQLKKLDKQVKGKKDV